MFFRLYGILTTVPQVATEESLCRLIGFCSSTVYSFCAQMSVLYIRYCERILVTFVFKVLFTVILLFIQGVSFKTAVLLHFL